MRKSQTESQRKVIRAAALAGLPGLVHIDAPRVRVPRRSKRSTPLYEIHDTAFELASMRERIEQFLGACSKYVELLNTLTNDRNLNFKADATCVVTAARHLAESLQGMFTDQEMTVEPEVLYSQRLALMKAVLESQSNLSGPVLKSAILASTDVLRWLLDRRTPAKGESLRPVELEALAISLCGPLLRTGRTDRRSVREARALAGSSEHVGEIETIVNRRYIAADGDRSILPIMFRKHGMSGSLLIRDASAYVSAMKEVETIFSDLGYDIAICYGTLLGAVRDHGFIPHDDDVDMAISVKGTDSLDWESEFAGIRDTLQQRNVRTLMSKNCVLKVRAPSARKSVDVFPIIPRDESSVSMYLARMNIGRVPREFVLPFGVISLYGTTFKAPAQPESFLAYRYGDTWRIPNRQRPSPIEPV